MIKHPLTLLLAAAVAAGAAAHAETLSVAATPVPHAELLEHVKPTLAKQGVELDIKVFTDYVQPNMQVASRISTSSTPIAAPTWFRWARCTSNRSAPTPRR